MSAARVDSCARCARPNHRTYIPDPHPTVYRPGDIWAAREHVSSAINRLFKASILAEYSRYDPRRVFGSAITWGSARSKRSTGLGPKLRPCLILQVTAQDVIICLLASFDGENRLSALPKVLQYFCIPIYPHPLARHPNTHCHTTPEWPEEGMWLIASPFSLKGRVEGRWQDRRPQGSRDGSFQLGPAETEAIIRACEQKQSHWEALCGAHEMAEKNYLQEYELHLLTASERKHRRSQDATFKSQPRAGPSRSGTDSYRPEQDEPEKQSTSTFGWLIMKRGKKGSKGTVPATSPVTSAAAQPLEVPTTVLEPANAERTSSPAVSVTSKSKNSPRLGALLKKPFSGSKSTLNLPG